MGSRSGDPLQVAQVLLSHSVSCCHQLRRCLLLVTPPAVLGSGERPRAAGASLGLLQRGKGGPAVAESSSALWVAGGGLRVVPRAAGNPCQSSSSSARAGRAAPAGSWSGEQALLLGRGCGAGALTQDSPCRGCSQPNLAHRAACGAARCIAASQRASQSEKALEKGTERIGVLVVLAEEP